MVCRLVFPVQIKDTCLQAEITIKAAVIILERLMKEAQEKYLSLNREAGIGNNKITK